jgi:hypothetical protein
MPSDVVALFGASLLGASLLPQRQELVPYAGYFDRSKSFSRGPPYATAAPYSAECVEGEFSEVELPLYGVLGSSPYEKMKLRR